MISQTMHIVGWWGSPNHPNINYQSWLPANVIAASKTLTGLGYAGVNILIDNPGKDARRLDTAYLWGALTSMELSIMIDHSFVDHRLDMSVTPEAEVIAWFQRPDLQKLFDYQTYLHDGRNADTRPRVLVFTDPSHQFADFTAIQAAVPNVFFLRQGIHFSWPSTSDPVGSIASQANLPLLEFSAAWRQFNDSDPQRPGLSVWSPNPPSVTLPARICPPFDKNGRVYDQMVKACPQNCRLLYATWDDIQEGTALMPWVG